MIKSVITISWIENLLILPVVIGKKLPNEVYIKVNTKLKATVKVKTVEIKNLLQEYQSHQHQ